MKNKDPLPLEFEKPLYEMEKKLRELESHSEKHEFDVDDEIQGLRKRVQQMREEIYSNLTPWQRVQIVRHPKRPFLLDYLGIIAEDFTELSGDRLYANDRAMVGGFAKIDKHQVMVIGQQKGRDLKENILRNFGSAHPEGYRKALRLMRMADKFGLPILAMIDTPGAYPGLGAEERHIGEAIAVNIREMFNLKVPILAVVLGEGGSGGALGIGVADTVLMMENAYYSVISPEGCAAILWKDRAYAPQAASALKMSAPDLKDLKLIDGVVPEPMGGAHRDWKKAGEALKEAVVKHFDRLTGLEVDQLLDRRYERYRVFGEFSGGK